MAVRKSVNGRSARVAKGGVRGDGGRLAGGGTAGSVRGRWSFVADLLSCGQIRQVG